MSAFPGLVRATILSLAVGVSLGSTPVANAAALGGAGFHGGGIGEFRSAFAGSGHRGGAGLPASAIAHSGSGLRNVVNNRAVQFGGEHRDWRRYGHWENGAWIGIWPDYESDPYDASWSYYCDPESPYFNPDDCGGN